MLAAFPLCITKYTANSKHAHLQGCSWQVFQCPTSILQWSWNRQNNIAKNILKACCITVALGLLEPKHQGFTVNPHISKWHAHITHNPNLVFLFGLCCMHVKEFHIPYTNTAVWLALYIDPGLCWSAHIPISWLVLHACERSSYSIYKHSCTISIIHWSRLVLKCVHPNFLACVACMWKNFTFHIQMQLCN